MNVSHLRATTAAALLAIGPLVLATATAPAAAQQRYARAPVLNGLQLNSDAGLDAGAQLQLRVDGTPGGRVDVRINEGKAVVTLRETSPGVYRGTHVIRRGERIDPTGVLHANLTVGNVTARNDFAFPPAFVALAAPVAPPLVLQQQALAPRIDRFELRSRGDVDPGSQIALVLEGAPGGQASANIPGVVRELPLAEVRPGVYRGSYTIRKQDNPDAFASAAATLRVRGQLVSANVTQPFAANAPATSVLGSAPAMLPLQVLSHGNNSVVDAGVTQLRGRTAPGASVRVRIDAVLPSVGQRAGVAQQLMADTVQADPQGYFTVLFDPRGMALPGTRYEVSITAGDGTQAAESRLVLYQRG